MSKTAGRLLRSRGDRRLLRVRADHDGERFLEPSLSLWSR